MICSSEVRRGGLYRFPHCIGIILGIIAQWHCSVKQMKSIHQGRQKVLFSITSEALNLTERLLAKLSRGRPEHSNNY